MCLEEEENVGLLLPDQLVLEVFDVADFLAQAMLGFYLVEVADDLPVQFQQAVVGFGEGCLDGSDGFPELGVYAVHDALGFFYKEGNVGPLGVQLLQAFAFDGIVPLVFVGAFDVAFEIDDVALRGHPDAAEDVGDFSHIASFGFLGAGGHPKLDVGREGVDVLPDGLDVDLFVHFQYFLKKAEVGVFQHKDALDQAYDTVVLQQPQASFVRGTEVFDGLFPPEGRRFPAREKEAKQFLFPCDDAKQCVDVPKRVHRTKISPRGSNF